MAAIQLIAKSTGQVTDVSGNNLLSLARPSVVKIAVSPDNVKSISRNGDSMVIHLKNGEVITINNFFHVVDGVRNDLVMEDSNHQLWLADYSEPWTGANLHELDSIDTLVAEQSSDHNPVLGLLVPAAGLGAIGIGNYLSAHGGGGGGNDRGTPPGEVPAKPEILFNNLQGLTGKGEPGSTITLTKPDGSTVTTTTAGDGTWHFNPNPLDNGTAGTVTASNGNGTSEPVSTGPADLVPPHDPHVTQNNGDGLAGTGEAGDTITLTKPDGSTVTTTVDQNGNWKFPENPLGNGETGTLVETDPAGNSSGNVSTGVADTIDPLPPTVDHNNGSGLGGTGEPGGTITVTKPDGSTVTTTVDGNGNWNLPDNPLGNGESGTVTVTDPAGNVSGETPTGPADLLPPKPPLGDASLTLIDNVAPITGTIERGNKTNDTQPEFKGKVVDANDAKTVNVYDNGVLIGSTSVNADGTWSFTPDAAHTLSEGNHDFQAATVDAAGNVSSKTADWNFIVDTQGPIDPLNPDFLKTLQLIDNVGLITGPIAKGGVTDDTQPELKGELGPNPDAVSVKVFDNGTLLGTATVGTDGKWSFTPDDAHKLAEGSHNLQVILVDGAGNESKLSDGWDFSVDTTAPPPLPTDPKFYDLYDDVGLVVGTITMGSTTDDANPEYKGTGVTSQDVKYIAVFDGDKLLGTTTVNGKGEWSFTPSTALAVGDHVFTARAVDAAGNLSAPSPAWNFNVDVNAPAAPSIQTIVDDEGSVHNLQPGDRTNDKTPTVNGTAEAGSLVTVYANGQAVGSAIADSTGKWAITTSPLGSDDTYAITAQAKDAAGQNSLPSGAFELILDTTAPAKPDVAAAYDNVGSTGAIAAGSTTDDAQPTFSGKTEPDAIVTIKDGATVLGSVSADSSGNWSFTPSQPLGNGDHSITTTVTDTAGNTSAPSDALPFSVDSTLVIVSIIAAKDNVGGIQTDVTDNGVTDDKTPTLFGTANPGALVTLYADGGSVAIGSVTASSAGTWEFTLPDQSGGLHQYSAVAKNAAGNVGNASFSLNVDLTAPNVPGSVVITDNVGEPGDGSTALGNGASTNDTAPVISGSGATPDDVITIYDGAKPLGSVTVDGNGNWSYKPESPLAETEHPISVTATDPAGNESAPSPVITITVDTTPPGPMSSLHLIDNVAPQTGEIAHDGKTNDLSPTFEGQLAAGDAAYVNVYDNGKLIGSTVVNANGTWSFTPSSDLSEGSHDFQAQAVDAAGNVGAKTADWNFSVDTTPPIEPKPWDPTKPEQLNLIDDVGTITGTIAHGGVTDDNQPQFKGTLDSVGDVVKVNVYDNGTLLGSASVNADGTWSFTPSTPLAEGAHNFQAVTVDGAGNESAKTADWNFTVDTTPPGVLPQGPNSLNLIDDVGAITGPIAHGGLTDDSKPEFKGTGAPADAVLVNIYDNGTLIGSATVSNGAWTFTPDTPLQGKDHNFQAAAVDAAGNEGAKTDDWNFSLLVNPPAAPALKQVSDDFGPITSDNLQPGQHTDDRTPTISGTAEANTVVTVFVNDTAVGSVAVGTDGTWSITTSDLGSDGVKTITAQAVDAAGQPSAKTGGFDIVLDTTAPAKPAQPSIDDNVGAVTGPVSNGVTDDTTPTLSGKTEPGAIVTIKDGSDVLGSVAADSNGDWSFTPSAPLAEGDHSITTVVTDAAGNASAPSDALPLVINTQPVSVTVTYAKDDVGSQQGNLLNNAVTDDKTPTLVGTATAKAVVTVMEGATVLGSTIADDSGNWTLALPTQTDGAHSYSVTASNGANSANASFALTVDSLAPSKPGAITVTDDQGAVTGPVTNGVTDDSTPTLSGKTEPDAIVTIKDNGTVLGTAVADSNGDWTFTPSQALPDGDHSISVTATDKAGNVSEPSDAVAIKVDTSNVMVSIDYAVDNVGVTENLINNALTNDATPTLFGKALAGAVVTISVKGGAAIGTAIADASGNWSFELPAQADGAHSYSASVSNGANSDSADFSLNIDTVAPSKPAVVAANDDQGKVQGSIAAGSTTDDALPVLSGKTEAGATVTIKDNGTVLGTALADSNGDWTFTPSASLADGPHSITSVVTDKAGNASAPSDALAFVVDTLPVSVSVINAKDDVGSKKDPLSDKAVTDDQTPTLVGTASAGAVVSIYIDGAASPVGSVIASSSGTWEFTLPNQADGVHNYSVVAKNAAGNEANTTFGLTVDTQAPSAPGSITVTDNVGNPQGSLSNGQSTDDTTPVISGSGATPGDVITIYDNGGKLGSVSVDGNGNWSYKPGTELNEGDHALSATATDPAGNESVQGPVISITVDTTAPGAIGNLDLIDDVGTIRGTIAHDGQTDDARPVFSGKLAAGEATYVNVYDGVTLLGTASVAADGNWTFDSPLLQAGAHNFTAEAVDAAGNLGTKTADWKFSVVDSSGMPNAPAVNAVSDNQGSVTGNLQKGDATDDRSLTVSGTSEQGNTVYLYVGGTEVGSALVDNTGKWSIETGDLGADGVKNITAKAVNPVGQVSPETGIYDVVLDTTAPAKPGAVSARDDVGNATGPISAGSTTDDAQPTFSGSAAEPGATVTILDGTTVLGTAQVAADGTWSFTPADKLGDGPHSISTTLTDPAGNTSAASDALSFTVDTSKVVVSIVNAIDDAGSIKGNVPTNGSTDDTTPSLIGTATANALVTIKEGSTVIGSVVADASGNWRYDLPTQSEATHTYTAVAKNLAGTEGSADFTLTVDTTPPPVPVITQVKDDVGLYTADLSSGAYTDDQTPTLYGTSANEGDLIKIYDNGKLLGSVVAGTGGAWNWNGTTDTEKLSEGDHQLSVTATDKVGNESQPSPVFDVKVDITAPGEITNLQLLDDVGSKTGSISGDNTITDDARPVYSGHVDGDAVLVRIYDKNELIGTAAVDASGNWSFTPGVPLPMGDRSFQAQAVDAAGNVGKLTDPWNFNVDPGKPKVPTITNVWDDFGPEKGYLQKTDITDDTTLTLTGTGSAGATLLLYACLSADRAGQSYLVGSVTIDAMGNWSLTTSDLSQFGGDGMKYLWANSQSPSGQMSANPTGDYPVFLDTSLPAAPSIMSFSDTVGTRQFSTNLSGAVSNDSTPTFSGTAKAGTTVKIFDNGHEVGTTLVDGNGDWSFTPSTALADGTHSFTAKVTDLLGNTSEASDPWQVVVDTVAPNIGLDINTAEQLAGQTEPGAIVTLVDKAGASHTVVADQNGRWSMQPNPLALGEDGSLSVADAAGNQLAPITIQGEVLASYDLTRYTAQVNTTETGAQANPSAATLKDGKIVVVWQSGPSDGSDAEIFMQLYEADGVTKVGDEQQINQRTNGKQDSPQVVALADGGYLVVWESWQGGIDNNADGVMARRYGADGTASTDEFLANVQTVGGQRQPGAVAHADGGYTITWLSDPDASSTDLIVQRSFGADNKALSGDVLVASGNAYGSFGAPEVAAFSDPAHAGLYVTVWAGTNGPGDNSASGVIGQLYKADGSKLGNAFQVNTTTGNDQYYPDVITLKDGSFVVVWEGNPPGSTGHDVYSAHYTVNPSTGAVQEVGGDVRVNSNVTGDQYKPTAVALNDGGYLVVWGSDGGDGSGSAVFAQRYSADGSKLGREFLVNPTTDGNQGWGGSNVDMTALLDATVMADGNVYVTWQSDKADSDGWGIESTVIDIDAGYYSEFRINSTTSGDQKNAVTVALPNGGAVVVWESANGDSSGTCVMAQMYDAKGMPLGSEFVVNSTTTNNQGMPAVEVLKDGSFVITWTSNAGGNDAVMQQRYSYSYDASQHINGAVRVGGEQMVNNNDLGDQRHSSVTALDNGGYLVSWKSLEGGKWNIYAREYDKTGSAVSGDQLVSNTNYSLDIRGASTTTLTDGKVVFAYGRDMGGSYGGEAYFRIYDPATKSFGAEIVANQTSANSQASPSVSRLTNGNFVVTWDSNDNSGADQSGYGTWGRVFDASGQPVSNEFLLTTSTLGNQVLPVVVAREGGGYVVVYQSASDAAPGAGTYGVYAQYFDATGHKVGQELHINQLVTGDQGGVDATFLASGKLFVTWTDSGVSDGSGSAIKGRLIDLDETLGLIAPPPQGQGASAIEYVPATPPVVTVLSVGLDTNSAEHLGGQTVPGATVVITVTVQAGVTQTFTTVADEGGRWDMYPNPLAQGQQGTLSAHDGSGHVADPVAIQGAALADFQLIRHTVQVNTTETGPQANPSTATLKDGKIVVVWQSGDTTANNADVYMQLYEADGVTRIGTEQQINQRNLNNQDSPQVVALADGGYLVVWESWQGGIDNNADGVMARRYGADGTATTDEFLVNVQTVGGQLQASAVAHADGGYTISWVSNPDASTTDLIVQRSFDADNKPLSGDVLVGSGTGFGAYGAAEMAAFSDKAHAGLYVTVWAGTNGPSDNSLTGVIGQLYKADGSKLGNAFQVNTTTGNDQYYPDVITLKDGSFVVVWEGNPPGSTGHDVYSAHYTVDPSTGAVQEIGGDVRVNSNIAGDQYKPTAVALNDGGYLVVWGSDGGDGSGSAVFAQRYSADGSKLGREFLVNPTTDGNQGWSGNSGDMTALLDATVMADGNVYVTWQGDKVDSNSWGIQGTVIDIDAGYYSEFRVNSTTSGDQKNAVTVDLPNGGAVVVWESANGDSSGTCVMAQMYDAKGMPLGSEFVVNSTTTNNQGMPAVDVLKDGSFVITWTSNAGGNDAVMQQRYSYTYDASQHINGAARVGGEQMVNNNDLGDQRHSSVTALDNGGYLVSWKSLEGGKWNIYAREYDKSGSVVSGNSDLLVSNTNYTSGYDIRGASTTTLTGGKVVFAYGRDMGGSLSGEAYFRIYDPATKSFGAEIVANQTSANSQASPSVSRLTNGNFVVTWDSDDHSGPDQSGYGTWGRVFNAAGQPVGNEFLLTTSTMGNQVLPVVVAREGGGYVVVYQSATDAAPGAGTYGVYAQYFDETGHKVGQELHINQLVSGDQGGVDATFLAGGQLFVTWTDNGVSDGSGSAVKGRLVDLDETLGLTPVVPEGGATSVAFHPVYDAMGTAGNDVLDARGYTTASGGAGNDTIVIDGTGFTRIDGGAGVDTLVWHSSNPLNLSAVSDKVHSIEAIHMTDDVKQTLSLTLSDLLKVTDADADQQHTLKISGDTTAGKADTVVINLSAWNAEANPVVEGNVSYDVYTSKQDAYAHLLIQHGLTVV
ncbi:Ig-like domain-containing protein [Pseudomonas panipatensis]|uniref:Ig-like domain (Group 3) n=2 Tax=Pseudomonas panipatensis TaxID=428992 RepID=A0A1G8FJ03_9PSED|nr:Ig-like domain-containing protein [Pseudomonas panipatensis]SDH82091.1 Ig-like domain (group 3) [Pseudomonas panipatensis]SMP53397.1 Ig-like domain (group 3) [Pseudomonas panipatensis]